MRNQASKFLSWLPFVAVWLLIVISFWRGVGQFWDWEFPLFASQLREYALQHLPSWESYHIGQAQAYMPTLIWYLVVGMLSFISLASEQILAVIIASVLTLTFWLASRLLSGQAGKSPLLIWGLSLAVVFNPAIFYKLLAGHLPYLLGFAFFCGLIWYLFNRYQKGVRSAVVVGILLALGGVQVQFLLFAPIILIIFFSYYPEKFAWKDFLTSLLIALLIHSFWIVNFFNGTVEFSAVSQLAGDNSFESLMRTPVFNVFTLTFTSATFIHRFFTLPYQIVATLLSLIVFSLLALNRGPLRPETKFWLTCWLVFTLAATGLFHGFNLPIVSKFYPLLREAGHAAPVVVLSLVGLLASLAHNISQRFVLVGMTVVVILFVGLSAQNILKFTPRLDYEAAREEFKEFEQLRDRDKSSYRVLAYPFFHQNRFIDQPQTTRLGTPMSNSGWDSYLLSSGYEYLDNSQSLDGPQQRLLESYDLAILDQHNVKYIFNFYDGIYASEAHHFLGKEAYSDDLKKRNSDSAFIDKLVAANPNRLKQVSPRIWEIADAAPRLEATTAITDFARVGPTRYEAEITLNGDETAVLLRSRYHPLWQLSVAPYSPFDCREAIEAAVSSECAPGQFSASPRVHQVLASHFQGLSNTNQWEISKDQIVGLGSSYYHVADDDSVSVRLVVEFRPERSHQVFLFVSLLTLILALAYLGLGRLRQSKEVV